MSGFVSTDLVSSLPCDFANILFICSVEFITNHYVCMSHEKNSFDVSTYHQTVFSLIMKLSNQMFYSCLTSSHINFSLYMQYYLLQFHVFACMTFCTSVSCKEMYQIIFTMLFVSFIKFCV